MNLLIPKVYTLLVPMVASALGKKSLKERRELVKENCTLLKENRFILLVKTTNYTFKKEYNTHG